MLSLKFQRVAYQSHSELLSSIRMRFVTRLAGWIGELYEGFLNAYEELPLE